MKQQMRSPIQTYNCQPEIVASGHSGEQTPPNNLRPAHAGPPKANLQQNNAKNKPDNKYDSKWVAQSMRRIKHRM